MAGSNEFGIENKGVTRRSVLKTMSIAALAARQSWVPASSLLGLRPEKKLRICVVGGGFGRSFYWHEHPDCEVTAVSELRDDRRKLLVERYKCNKAYGDFHEMLKDPNVDAVAMFTPAPQHVDDCVDVLNAGKHVVCACPAAYSLEQCQRLVDTVKRTGLTYMQAETSCYHAATMTAYKMARDGQFGAIYFTQGEYLHDEASFHNGQPPPIWFDPEGRRTWRYGSPPAKYPTHATGPVILVSDDPMVAVSCIGWGPQPYPYLDNPYKNRFYNVTFLAKTRGGNTSRIAVHFCFGGLDDIGERAEYWGTNMVFLENRYPTPTLISKEGQKFAPAPLTDHAEILPPNLRNYVVGGHGGAEVFITNEFVRAVLDGRRPTTDVYQGIAYCAPGICADESASKDSEWIKVPDFGWHT
jgi:hypothetical protein